MVRVYVTGPVSNLRYFTAWVPSTNITGGTPIFLLIYYLVFVVHLVRGCCNHCYGIYLSPVSPTHIAPLRYPPLLS